MLQKRLLIVSSLAILLMPAAPVLARDGSDDTTNDQTATQTETETQTTTETHKDGTRLAEDKTKLKDAKLTSCRNREKSINNRLQNMAKRGDRQLKVFDTIASRVEKFATDKNAKPANYDSLVAAVDSQKAAATAAVAKIKGDSVSFKCDGTDPKGSLGTFKTDLKSEISALKSYRTSVKNLIVGVKTSLNNSGGDSNESAQ
jgi:hypothetical protein